jgi:adenylate cyclase
MRLAVLDCDLVGFSRLAARMTPESTAAALRAYHGFVEAVVFAHHGAVLKYTGDGVSAVFGFTGEADAAANALASAEQLAADWPAVGASAFAGEDPPALVVGVDYGEVTAGIVGEGRALSLIVTGPAVAEAERLQALRGGEPPVRASAAVRG